MSLLLLLEGATELAALPTFLGRWLEKEAGRPIRLRPVDLKGSGNYVRELRRKIVLFTENYPDITGCFGLLDLYGLDLPYPKTVTSSAAKQRWAKQHLEAIASHPSFRQHFAVHDVEAWLLSDPALFDRSVRDALPKKAAKPEAVNFDTPPAELLKSLHLMKTPRAYRKRVDGKTFFNKLDPHLAASKCPALQALLQDMLAAAKLQG